MMTESSILLSISELQTQAACALAADLLIHRQWMLTTAESCTGGLMAAHCTDLAGSSAWFERGFVTYVAASLPVPSCHQRFQTEQICYLVGVRQPHGRSGPTLRLGLPRRGPNQPTAQGFGK